MLAACTFFIAAKCYGRRTDFIESEYGSDDVTICIIDAHENIDTVDQASWWRHDHNVRI